MTVVATKSWVAAIDERIEHRDYRTAIELVERELALNGQLTEQDHLILGVQKAESLAFLGQYREAVSVGRRAAKVLRRGDDHELFARSCFALSAAQYFMGDLDQATENVNLALFSYKRADNHLGVVRALNWLGNIFFVKSYYKNSLLSYEQCVDMARERGMSRWVAVARDNMARAHLLLGELCEARTAFQGNRKIYDEIDEPLNGLRHDLSCAYLDILGRNFEQAEAMLTRIGPDNNDSIPLRDRGIWYEYFGDLELNRGNLDAATGYLEAAIEIGKESGPDESLIGQSRRLLAEVRLAQGNLDLALAECERALASIHAVGERIEEGVIYRVLAEIHARCGATEDAETAFRRSLDILQTIGARLEWAKTSLAAGCCSMFGERERLSFLFEAQRLLADVEIAYWNDNVHAALENILREKPAAAQAVPEPEIQTPQTDISIVTVHQGTKKLLHVATRYANGDMAILITGETGTGKDLLARYIHSVSPRRDKPFVSIDVTTLTPTLWEAQLFGHCKGAWTDSGNGSVGLLESANGGTVFLNEIGNLPLELQAKLRELLETRQIRRVGEAKSITLDVRFIAATNVDLEVAVANGTFLQDLYYRLEEAPLKLVPLRERREDIVPLIQHFLAEFKLDPAVVEKLSDQAWIEQARNAPWPGNIRQLRSFLRRLRSMVPASPNGELASWANQLMDHTHRAAGTRPQPTSGNNQYGEMIAVLERNNWNQRATARELGITEGGVRDRMRRLKIKRPGR